MIGQTHSVLVGKRGNDRCGVILGEMLAEEGEIGESTSSGGRFGVKVRQRSLAARERASGGD